MNEGTRKAFVLRIAPSGIDAVSTALKDNEIFIGWSNCKGLIEEKDWVKFRQIVHDAHYKSDDHYRRSSMGAGHLKRFIHEMSVGDYVIVPHPKVFYLAEVAGSAYCDETKLSSDSVHRRPVKWLNGGKPISREYARAPLISRMKIRGTSAYAIEFVDEIEEILNRVTHGEKPGFTSELKVKLVQQTVEEIRTGFMDPDRFESLIASVLRSLGASSAKVVPKKFDKGADVVATFSIAGVFDFILAVQAKQYLPTPPVEAHVVEHLVDGMRAENAHQGWVVTSGTFSDDAEKTKEKFIEDGIEIRLINGEEFAEMIVENGLKVLEG